MFAKICLASCLLACVPAWSQAQANYAVNNTGTNAATDEANNMSQGDPELQVPPPVSVQPYESTFEGEEEGNYLRGGVTFTGAWSSNVSFGTAAVGDMSYSIWPTIGLDKTTYRMHLVLDYAPGFTLYQRTSSRNQADQSLAANLTYRLSPNLTARVTEGFLQTSNMFNQPNPVAATPVSGGLPVGNVAVIAPLPETINSSAAQLTYQVSANGMIGGGGNYSTLSYLNPDQVAGLFNSRAAGGSFFYSTRIHERNYIGAGYQYQNFLSFQTNSPSTQSQVQTVFLFYTMYLKPNWSISVAGGPQHYSSTQSFLPSASAWQPMIMVSMNWQGLRSTVAASYAHTVSGGGGLNGTFNSNSFGLSFARQLSRNWYASGSGSYSNNENLTPSFLFSSPSGHSLSGAVALQRKFNEHAGLQFGYNWTQQNYSDPINTISAPNVNGVFLTLSLAFARPLHR